MRASRQASRSLSSWSRRGTHLVGAQLNLQRLIAASFDIVSIDGINEVGLAGHLLWPAEADYGTYDESRTGLPLALWLQYFLDNSDIDHLPEPKSQVEAITALLSVMRNTAQPFRVPDPDKPFASQTLWQTVIDLTNKRYVFESTTRPNIVWVDLDELDFSEGASAGHLDLVGDTALEGGLAGHVAGDFEATEPLRLLTGKP